MNEERKYFVKQSWIFNLESMHDFIWCIIYDVEDNKLDLPIVVAGNTIKDIDHLYDLIDECCNLEWIAKSRKVTSREYGRIKQIVEFRVNQRYLKCMASGMSDYKAGVCFEDI